MRCPACGSFLQLFDFKIGLYECSQLGCSCIVQYIHPNKLLKEQIEKKNSLDNY